VCSRGSAPRALDRLAYAHDASHYLLTPHVVLLPTDMNQVSDLFKVCRNHGVPLTFRFGGTSLSGQASTHGMMLDTRRNFRKIEALSNGERVRVQPGATARGKRSTCSLPTKVGSRSSKRGRMHYRGCSRQQLKWNGVWNGIQYISNSRFTHSGAAERICS
jgi:hypothetical protein